jgi:hypothetical protein
MPKQQQRPWDGRPADCLHLSLLLDWREPRTVLFPCLRSNGSDPATRLCITCRHCKFAMEKPNAFLQAYYLIGTEDELGNGNATQPMPGLPRAQDDSFLGAEGYVALGPLAEQREFTRSLVGLLLPPYPWLSPPLDCCLSLSMDHRRRCHRACMRGDPVLLRPVAD